MQCNQFHNEPCDNENMERCKVCKFPRLCLCARDDVQAMLRTIYHEDANSE